MHRLAILLWLFPTVVVAQSSEAVRWLLWQEAQEACSHGGGAPSIRETGLIERDFDGDGAMDLMIAHEGFICGEFGRSGYCGAQVCTFKIWLSRGGQLVLHENSLGMAIAVDDDVPPVISGHAHGGAAWTMRWSGTGFR